MKIRSFVDPNLLYGGPIIIILSTHLHKLNISKTTCSCLDICYGYFNILKTNHLQINLSNIFY